MGMPLAPLYYTVEMVQALPDDGNRYEAVHGELLVTPSPFLGHQRLVGRLYLALAPHVARYRLGEIFMAPADLVHGPASIVEPDLLVLPFGGNEHGPSELAAAVSGGGSAALLGGGWRAARGGRMDGRRRLPSHHR
jgi:hypothetical protein